MYLHHLRFASLVLMLINAFCSVNPSEATPSILDPIISDKIDMSLLRRAMRQGNLCDTNETIRDLCQRCAKETKSTVVYPLCCQPMDNPRIWCMKYLSFGIVN